MDAVSAYNVSFNFRGNVTGEKDCAVDGLVAIATFYGTCFPMAELSTETISFPLDDSGITFKCLII